MYLHMNVRMSGLTPMFDPYVTPMLNQTKKSYEKK